MRASERSSNGLIRFFSAPVARCLAYRGILGRTTVVELTSLYAGSVLGLSWIVIGQLTMLAIYTLTYTVIFKVQPAVLTVTQYVLYVFAGLVPYLAFSASLSGGSTSLTKDRQVLLNTVFPSELLPVRSTLIASATLPIGMSIVVASDIVLDRPTPHLLLVPVFMLLQVMFQCGVAWILALITLVLRDIQFALQYVTMLLLIITPIGYTMDMMPSYLKVLAYGNPLFYFVTMYQNLIVYNQLPGAFITTVCVLMSLLTFACGYWLFERAKSTFFDYA
jgi:homopolymeric O-antigen transport system permease protein